MGEGVGGDHEREYGGNLRRAPACADSNGTATDNMQLKSMIIAANRRNSFELPWSGPLYRADPLLVCVVRFNEFLFVLVRFGLGWVGFVWSGRHPPPPPPPIFFFS